MKINTLTLRKFQSCLLAASLTTGQNTRGFLTEYASVLSKESEKKGCNIAILTDFDASGLLIAKNVPFVSRIGIDFETLEYLGIDARIVEETYEPKQNHIKPLEHWAYKMQDRSLNEKVDYVHHKRIEMDSILAALNNNAIFWEFVLLKLQERFHTRDYNRAIDIPEYVMPDSLEELNDIVRENATSILTKVRMSMQKRFANNSGFLDIRKYDKSIPDHLKGIVENDNSMKELLKKIEEIVASFT
jgi:5S rRNA maturation endonuclease (ribonuclease M5)